jgi:hypothetical protein
MATRMGGVAERDTTALGDYIQPVVAGLSREPENLFDLIR